MPIAVLPHSSLNAFGLRGNPSPEPTQQHTSAARLLPARVQAVRQQKTALRCAAQYLLMADGQTRADKSSVLFVCLGNICRCVVMRRYTSMLHTLPAASSATH